jgi:hypothetical protein
MDIIGRRKYNILEGKMTRILKISMLFTAIFILFISPVYSQKYNENSLSNVPIRSLIFAPTAGTLPRGCFDVAVRVMPNGGILAATGIGLSNRFLVGMSYGAEGIIGEGEPIWNPRIEFDVKLRVIDEEYYMPAFTIGYNSQGYGPYCDSCERYAYKSKGFYVVASRSFHFYKSSIGGHAGINYSLEHQFDHDEDPSLFFGFDTRFNEKLSFLMEYDAALNDDRIPDYYGKGKGYLNVGVKWLFSDDLEMEIIFDNLMNNRAGVNSFGRGLRFTYLEFF